MLTLEQALLTLFDTVRGNKRHKDYEATCNLAKLYRQLITGEDIDELLLQFVRREDDMLFEQRKAITQQICPAWAESIMTAFFRIGRLDNVTKGLLYPDNVPNADAKRTEIMQKLSRFYGRADADRYLATRFAELSFTDPNSFIAVEFDDFNPTVEKASPYPIEYSSREAINYKYQNNVLQWLIIQEPNLTVDTPNGIRQAQVFRMYLPNDVIRLVQTFEFENYTGLQYVGASNQIINDIWQADTSRTFRVQLYQPKAGEVQAFRIGYKSDLRTDSRTFVNPFHAAVPYFKKSIKVVSELDLTECLHAYPQKLQRAEPCPGVPEENIQCNRGVDQKNRTCKVCKGKGVLTHTTTQDIITVPMPKVNGQAPAVALDDIVRYISPPVELMQFQSDRIDALEEKAKRTVFNADVLVKTQIKDTATGAVQSKDEMYNTFHPYAENASEAWKFFARMTAAFTDNSEGLTLIHEYPKDYKLKTIEELLIDLKAATDSGAASFLIQSINRDIAAKINVDNEYAFLKHIVKEKFTPFLGRTSEEIIFIITNGKARIEDEILWTHNDVIFDELEQEEPGFFRFTYEKQWPLIKAKIDLIASQLPAVSTAMTFGAELGLSAGENGGSEDPRIKLRNSVGGSQIINEVRLQVAKGFATLPAAIRQLEVQLGYTTQEAKDLIGNPQDLSKAVREGEVTAAA